MMEWGTGTAHLLCLKIALLLRYGPSGKNNTSFARSFALYWPGGGAGGGRGDRDGGDSPGAGGCGAVTGGGAGKGCVCSPTNACFEAGAK